MVELYSAKNSCGFAAVVCLEEAGLEYVLHSLDLGAGAQRLPSYLAINPHGVVPALVAEGQIITELLAVLSYIDGRVGGRLIGSATLERAKAYEVMAWFSTTVHVAIAQIFRGERFTADTAALAGIAARGRAKFEAAAEEFERIASRRGDWMGGEAFGVLDALGLVAWRWVRRLELDVARFPAWAVKAERAMGLPAVRRALAREGETASLSA